MENFSKEELLRELDIRFIDQEIADLERQIKLWLAERKSLKLKGVKASDIKRVMAFDTYEFYTQELQKALSKKIALLNS